MAVIDHRRVEFFAFSNSRKTVGPVQRPEPAVPPGPGPALALGRRLELPQGLGLPPGLIRLQMVPVLLHHRQLEPRQRAQQQRHRMGRRPHHHRSSGPSSCGSRWPGMGQQPGLELAQLGPGPALALGPQPARLPGLGPRRVLPHQKVLALLHRLLLEQLLRLQRVPLPLHRMGLRLHRHTSSGRQHSASCGSR